MVERFVYTEDVGSSSLSSPTIPKQRNGCALSPLRRARGLSAQLCHDAIGKPINDTLPARQACCALKIQIKDGRAQKPGQDAMGDDHSGTIKIVQEGARPRPDGIEALAPGRGIHPEEIVRPVKRRARMSGNLGPGQARPVANSNFAANEILNNVFTVGLGQPDGAFKIFVTTTTNVVVDVTGYYAPPGKGGLYFHPLPKPIRLMDTRATATTGCNLPGTPIAAMTDTLASAHLTCDGVTIPTSARAIVGNATVVAPGGNGFLTLFPADATRPFVASSNYRSGQVMNGPFTAGLTTSGQFKIYSVAQTELVIDVLGYYSNEASDVNGTGLLFTPLPSPVRLLETRTGQAVGCTMLGMPISGGSSITQTARGTCDGMTVDNSALAIVGNATVVGPLANGFLTMWPSSATQPFVAASNYALGKTFNRHFIVGLGSSDGAFKVFSASTTNLVIDLSGYFAP